MHSRNNEGHKVRDEGVGEHNDGGTVEASNCSYDELHLSRARMVIHHLYFSCPSRLEDLEEPNYDDIFTSTPPDRARRVLKQICQRLFEGLKKK